MFSFVLGSPREEPDKKTEPEWSLPNRRRSISGGGRDEHERQGNSWESGENSPSQSPRSAITQATTLTKPVPPLAEQPPSGMFGLLNSLNPLEYLGSPNAPEDLQSQRNPTPNYDDYVPPQRPVDPFMRPPRSNEYSYGQQKRQQAPSATSDYEGFSEADSGSSSGASSPATLPPTINPLFAPDVYVPPPPIQGPPLVSAGNTPFKFVPGPQPGTRSVDIVSDRLFGQQNTSTKSNSNYPYNDSSSSMPLSGTQKLASLVNPSAISASDYLPPPPYPNPYRQQEQQQQQQYSQQQQRQPPYSEQLPPSQQQQQHQQQQQQVPLQTPVPLHQFQRVPKSPPHPTPLNPINFSPPYCSPNETPINNNNNNSNNDSNRAVSSAEKNNINNNSSSNSNSNNSSSKMMPCPHGCLGRSGEVFSLPMMEMEKHAMVCALRPVPCPNGCFRRSGEIYCLPAKDVDDHRAVCTLELIPCSYGESICSAKVARKDIVNHQNDHALHLPLLAKTVKGLEERVRDLENEKRMFGNPLATTGGGSNQTTTQNQKIQKIEAQISDMEKVFNHRFAGLESALEDRLGNVETTYDDIEGKIKRMQVGSGGPRDDISDRLKKCEELIYDLERAVSLRLVFKVKEVDLQRIVHSPAVTAAGGRSINLTFGPSHLMWAGSMEGLKVAGPGSHAVWLFVGGGTMPCTAKITFELVAGNSSSTSNPNTDGTSLSPGSSANGVNQTPVDAVAVATNGSGGHGSVIKRCEVEVNNDNKGSGIPSFISSQALVGPSPYNQGGVITLIADVLIK